jgi:hypothetical protein
MEESRHSQCTDSVVDVERLVSGLRGGLPPATAPAMPGARRWPALALAAALLLGAGGVGFWQSEPVVAFRGIGGAPQLDLRIAVSREGRTYRVNPSGSYFVGETVYFRVASSPAGEVLVSVSGPAGQEIIGRAEASPRPTDLGGPTGVVAYDFPVPGSYTFTLSPSSDPGCSGSSCARMSLEVR